MSNHIKKFTQEQKDAAKLGAEGGLGLVAGTIGRIGKEFGNAAKQYLKGFKNASDWRKKILFSKNINEIEDNIESMKKMANS